MDCMRAASVSQRPSAGSTRSNMTTSRACCSPGCAQVECVWLLNALAKLLVADGGDLLQGRVERGAANAAA